MKEPVLGKDGKALVAAKREEGFFYFVEKDGSVMRAKMSKFTKLTPEVIKQRAKEKADAKAEREKIRAQKKADRAEKEAKDTQDRAKKDAKKQADRVAKKEAAVAEANAKLKQLQAAAKGED